MTKSVTDNFLSNDHRRNSLSGKVHPAGLEPATFGSVDRRTDSVITDEVGRSGNSLNSVAPKVATDVVDNDYERLIEAGETDPELARLVSAWPTLSAMVKRMILAALDASQGQGS